MKAIDFLDGADDLGSSQSAESFLDAAEPKKQNKGILGDIGTGLKRGVEQMPGMVTGIADIAAAPVSAITGINRPFSRAADYVGEKTGFQPAKWAEQAAQEYSPEMQQSLKAVEQADGFTGTLKAIGENPRSAVNLIAESLPSTLAGGILARGAMGAVVGAEKLAAMKAAGDTAGLMKAGAIAGGIGEGAVTAGQQMSQTDYNVNPLRAAGAATAAGIGTGIIGGISGRVANKLGLADIEGSIAAGTLGAGKKAGMGAYAGRIAGGAVQEGALEELPQSAQEQVWQNLANGKPWNEGVGKASAQGLVAGMAMGAGVNALPGSSGKQEAAPPIVPPARDSINLITDPAPLQGRIDSLLGIGDKPMSDAQRAQYAKDLEASFGEVVGYAAGADGLEVPVTMEDYLRSTLSAADMTRDKPLAAGANDQSANRLNQLADEEATQQPDIAPGYVLPVIPVVGPLSAIANAAVQSGAHQTAVMQQAAAQAAKNTPPEGKAGTPAGAQNVATAPAQGPLTEVAGQAPNVATSAPNVATPASAFDVSGKNLLQLKHLAAKGQPGWKEAATAELARRNGSISESVPALNAGNSVNLPATSISSLQDQLDKTEPFSEQSQLLTERLQLAVTDDAKSAIGAGEMPVYKVTDHVSVAIHPSAQKEGMIQVTRYTKDGVIGDSQYNSIDEAVRFEGLTHKPRIPSNEAIAHIENSIAAEAEYQKRKNEQQAGAGLPASTAGGSRPAPVANAPSRTFDPKGLRPGTPEYNAAFDAWNSERAQSQSDDSGNRQREENKSAVAKKNGWRKRLIDWFNGASHGDTITTDIEGEQYQVVEKTITRNGKQIKQKLLVEKNGSGEGSDRVIIENRDGESHQAPNTNQGIDEFAGNAAQPETETDSKGASLGKLLEDGIAKTSTANQVPVKNAAPTAATVPAETVAPSQEPIKNEDDWLGALFGAAPTAAESASKEVQTNRQAQDKADRVDSAIAMLTGEIEASNAAAAELAARNYKSNRKQIELKGDGPGKNGSLSISAINESRKRRTVEALQNASSSIKQAIEFIAENPDAAFKQVADMEAAVTKQFNEGFFGPSAKLDGQLDMAVGSLIGSGSYSGEGSAGRKLRMAAHAYASVDAVSQPKTGDTEKSVTGPLRITENADMGQFTARTATGESMGSFQIKDGKVANIKARAQWAMDDVRAAAEEYAKRQSQPKTDAAPEAAVDYNGDSKEVGRMVGRLYSAFHNSPKGTGDGFNPISIDDISAAIEEAKKVGITVSKRPDTSYSAVWDISTPAGNEYLAYLSPEGRGTWKSFADNAKAAPEAKQEQAPAITEPVDLGKVNSQMPEGFEARDEGTSLALYKDGKRTDIYGLSRVNGADELLRHAKMRADKAKASDADTRFASNTIFTADKVAAAKARMKAKLGTMNSGIDPELLIDGMTVAGAYIESGVRKFADYAKAMVEDLGDGVKPYLLSFYEAARAYPGLNKMGMDNAESAASQHQALLTPEVKEAAKEVIGQAPKVEKTRPANLGESLKLKQDWGVKNIDGYTRSKTGKNQETDEGLKGGIKDEFLADATRYLKQVEKLLAAHGFTAHTDKKGKPGKAVSANEGGPAVGGDVSLVMRRGDFGIYADVGVTNIRGMGPSHPQGVSLMVRTTTNADKNRYGEMNQWLSLDLSSGDLAAWFDKQYQAFAKRSAEVKPAAPAKVSYDLSKADDKFKVATEIADFLIGGGEFKTIIEARKKISEMIGRPIEAATELAKQADETIETAVVLAGRDIVKAGRKQGRSSEVIYDRLVDLYRRQPNLAVRSSTSVRDQAYSTPVPLAFLASELAGITYDTKVLEPTAGNGMLLIGTSIGNAVANELNHDRAGVLRSIGFNPTERNAATEQLRHAGYPVDAVIANPPFGATKDANGDTIIYDIKPGFKTREVDHAIVFKSLESMKDDGRAVLIVGGVQSEAEDARREDYRGSNKRSFYYNLYNEYNVIDHFTVDGGLYSKQGASYPVDIIVIDGRGKSSRDLPAANLPVIFKSYDSLKEKLNGNGRVESEPVVGANGTDSSNGKAGNSDSPAVVGSAVGSSGKDGNGSAAGVSSAGVQNDGHSDNGQPSGGGAVSGGGKPKSANASGSVDGVGVSDANRNSEAGSKTGNRGNGSADLGGVSVVNGERVESGLTDRRGKEQETGHQVAYTPHSNAASVGTLVPRAMKDSIAASLQKISDEVGSIDDYVAESLAMDLEDVKVNFSAEQIDALALAIRNAEAGKGFIIGDQTGIGKGRVVAAMIRYALVTGKTPIFVTEKPNLYSDMIRDLDDIGMTAELALDTKNPKVLITNGGESIPYTLLRTENGEVVENNLLLRAPKSGKALDQIMQGMMDGDSLGEYKVIFTTYSQLQTVKGATTTRQKFIQRFGEGNYMVFDESHNAGGSGPNERARGKNKDDTRYGGESTTNATGRSAFVRNLVQKAFGTFFSSATYAKRPDVMDLYSSTNMKLSVDRISELGDAIKSGGVPMQQVVANMLTKDGQYIRRERTFAGVSYDTQETKVDKATAENMASAMRSILAFSRAKESVLKEMQKEMDREGGMLREMGGEKSSVQGANFGSIMHNLIDQMLLSLKVQDSVSHAIERLKAGEKVVLTVSNTMGSFLKDYSEELGLSAGDPVSMSFADLYDRYLEKQRMVTIKDGGGNKRQHRLTDAELGPRLVDMFNAVRKQIESSGFGSAPISPIDYMHNELRKAGYKTDEITGRTIALNYSSGTPLLASRTANIRQRVKAVSGFNNGETDVLILNQAGSTGLSLHASSKFKDKRKRHMIIVQAEKNIDTHMQMLGRVHRTGQVVAPAYSQMMADIPAEMRPASVLMKKMASLNANTTASRTSSVTAEGVVDFMNNYGGQVVHEYLRDNPDVLEAVGGNKVISLADDPAEAGEDDIRKFTGYIPILPIKQQEEVYRELVDRYNELIERENSLGTNKLEAKAVDLDAETISSQTVTEDRGDPSVFASPANMEKVDVKRTVKPYSSEEVAAMVSESLDGKTANQVAATQLADLFDKATAYGKEKVAKMVADEVDPVKLDSQKAQLQLVLSHARTVLNTYKIGDSISVKDQIGQFVYGVITKIERSGRTANPAAGSAWKMHVALANGDAKSITLSFSQIGSKYELRAENRVEWYNTDTQIVERIPVSDIFDKGAKVRREKRWIVTGNILAGFARFPGQIITYTKNDGTTAQGVLMSRQFDFEKEQKNAPVRIKDGKAAIKFFTNGGQGGIIGTPDRFLMIAPRRGEFEITVPSSKKDGGTYYLDTGLTNIVGDFYKRGSIMSASVYTTGDVERVVNYLVKDREETIIALSNVEKAKELLEGNTGAGNIAAPGSMSPADKAIYGMAAEGKSAAEVLKFIASASRNPFNRQVARLLMKTGIAPSITVGDGKGWKMNAGDGNKYAAAYNPKSDTVSLFRPASAERNMLHELIHAATLKALSKKGMASAQMNALYTHVKKSGKLKGMYGMSDVDEFIAEAFSNPKFQAMLKQVSAAPVGGKPSSEWDWFIRVVRVILGLKQGADNALSQALDIGVGVMRENMALQSGDGVIRFNHALRSNPEGNRPLNAIRLANLRRIAAGLERPKDAVFLRVTEDGKAITTGPKGVRIPEAFIRFAESNGLDFEARRNGEGRKSDGHTIGEHITSKTEAMPPEYRESGALYFGEGNEFFDRTGKTRYNQDDTRTKQTDTAAFRKWFGSSAVVDANGEPLVVYHGAPDVRGIFANGFEARNRGGVFFAAADYGVANSYALDHRASDYQNAEPQTIPLFLSIKNPMVVDAKGANWKETERHVQEAKDAGYDGIIIKNSVDYYNNQKTKGKTTTVYAWFAPTQAKSAVEGNLNSRVDLSHMGQGRTRPIPGATGNNGDFDATNPDIRYNVADEGWSVSEQAKETVMRLAGRPMLDPSDPFAAENARLREQDQSLWSKAKKQLRRYLAPGGLLPQSVFAEKIKRDSEFQAVEFDVRHLIGGLEHAVKADFGMAFDKLSKEQMRQITEALAGNVPASLPEATKTAAVAMRQYIDGMSTEYLKIIQQKIDAKMLKAIESGKDSDKAQAINEIELFEKIKGNIGRYVHRSYQAFDDPKWFEKVPASVLNASRLYLKQGYMEAGEADAKAAQMAEVTLHEILKNGTAYDSMESFIAESKLGAKDLSVLMRRKEVPAQIRALLGEYPDARLNFTKSATKMGRLIWNTRFLDRVRDMGMGSFFFEGKDRPPNATTQIAADGSEVYAPLNGLWTFPETAQAFKDALGKEQMSDLYRAIVRANGLVKYGKTVLAPTTAMRNWQSAMFFSLANGHFDLTQMKKSISAFREQVSQKATGQDLKYLHHLKQLGVVYDTPYAGEMARLMEDARMEELLSSDKGDAVRLFRKANQLAQGFYTFGDDFWKIIGFENEKAGLMKAGLSLQEAETEAAKRIRDTYPTYSMVGRGVQWLSRFPLAGTFVSFPAEIIRTSGNMLRTVAADLKSDNPKLRELGMKRAAGMVFVSAAFYSLAALSMAMAGVGDDEDEAIRDLAPEWQKNSTFLYLGRDEKGNLRYFDTSFLDPYGYWKRPITAMLRNQPWEDSLASGLRGMLEPFIGADIAAKAIFEAVANQKESGGKVYKEKDGAINQTIDVADHLRKALQPGVAGNVERLVKAAGDVRKSSGQPYSMEDELVALVGWRATTIDPKTALYYRSFEFTDAVAEARKTITETLRDANEITPEDISDAKARAQAKQEQAFKEMHRLVSAAESAGMSKMQIVQTLRLSNISQANIAALMRGATPDVAITPQLAARAVRQASQMRGPEYAAEVFDRYRQARAN